MKIVIMAAGSQGDVAPYTGMGVRLRDAGHEVALATHESFAPLVRESGLAFRRLPADRHGAASMSSSAAGAAGRRTEPTGRSLMGKAAAFIRELGQGIADAAGPGTGLLLLSVTTAPLGWQVAEAMGIPGVGVYLQPVAPTSEFPPAVGGVGSLGRWGNRAAGRLSVRVADRMYAAAVKQLRARLGLPAASPAAVRGRQGRAGWPVLHGFSPVLVPRPADWPDGYEVTGYWWPRRPGAWSPPAELEKFLASGPPQVFFGFGDVTPDDTCGFIELAADAGREAGVRQVIQAGPTGQHPPGGPPPGDSIVIGDAPHDWLFPRMAAVVHHAGAGTTAAGLRAGVPSVTVPVALMMALPETSMAVSVTFTAPFTV